MALNCLKLLRWLVPKILHPLVFKSVVAIQPPLQWKGGHLFEIYKGKGSRHDIQSYRDVTICEAASKAMSKPMRKNGVPILNKISSSMHFFLGGGA